MFISYTKTTQKPTLCARTEAPSDPNRKFIVFLRTHSAGKITQDNIGNDLFYLDWSPNALTHFEVLTRNVFLPMLSMEEGTSTHCDKMLDMLHKLLSITQIVQGKEKVRCSYQSYAS